jgi:hypothetical protein
LILVLDREDRLRILSETGETLRAVAPPPGYLFSHLVEGEQAVICRGEAPHRGWRDWRFDLDPASGRLTRAGPAY